MIDSILAAEKSAQMAFEEAVFDELVRAVKATPKEIVYARDIVKMTGNVWDAGVAVQMHRIGSSTVSP